MKSLQKLFTVILLLVMANSLFAQQTATITVNPKPTVSITNVSATSICAGETVSFKINIGNTGGFTGPWSVKIDGTPVTITTNPQTFTSGALSANHTFSISEITYINGGKTCTFTLTPVTQAITVNPYPEISNIGTIAISDICAGSPATVSVTVTSLLAGNYDITYDISAPNAATSVVASNVTVAGGAFSFATGNLANAGNTTITLKSIKYNGGNCSINYPANTDKTFAVNPVPVISPVGTLAISAICAGSPATVSVTGTSLLAGNYDITYDISAPNAATSVVASNVTVAGGAFSFATGNLANAGNTTITLKSIKYNGGNCSINYPANTDKTFAVNALPTATISDVVICEDDAAILTVTLGVGNKDGLGWLVNYNMTNSTGGTVKITPTNTTRVTTATNTITIPATTSVDGDKVNILSVTDGNGCVRIY